MRFPPAKSVKQQDIQSLHRVRSRLVSSWTQLANQIRGLLTEYGIVLPQQCQPTAARLAAPPQGCDQRAGLFQPTPICFALRRTVVFGRKDPGHRRANLGRVSSQRALPTNRSVGRNRSADSNRSCCGHKRRKDFYERPAVRHLARPPTPAAFEWREARLRGISKRGDPYLRTLLIHGARSVLYRASQKTDRLSLWTADKQRRLGTSKACVDVANKNARIVWSLIARGEVYRRAP